MKTNFLITLAVIFMLACLPSASSAAAGKTAKSAEKPIAHALYVRTSGHADEQVTTTWLPDLPQCEALLMVVLAGDRRKEIVTIKCVPLQ